jgi:hypothetical protein
MPVPGGRDLINTQSALFTEAAKLCGQSPTPDGRALACHTIILSVRQQQSPTLRMKR